jgi:hypothetical protein
MAENDLYYRQQDDHQGSSHHHLYATRLPFPYDPSDHRQFVRIPTNLERNIVS